MSFPRYPSYKDSGVEWLGEVPEHWEVKRLKYLGEALIGLTYDPTEVVDEGNGTLVLRSSNVQGGKIVFDDNVYVSKTIPDRLVTQTGDILICSRNGSRALIGKNAVIDEQAAGLTFGAFMTVFRSDHSGYLAHVLNSQLFEYQSGAFLTSTINQLTVGVLNNFEVPMPPFSEQFHIGEFLERETRKIDRLVGEQSRLMELLKEKRQAVISHAVTQGLNPKAPMKPSGIEWLCEVPEHWEVKKMKQVSSLKGRLGWQGLKAEEYRDEGPFVVSSAHFDYFAIDWDACPHVSAERYDLDNNIQLREGDVLLMKDGAALGKLAYLDHLPDRACLNSHLLLFRPFRTNQQATYISRFLFFLMRTDYFQEHITLHATGTTFLGISQEEIGNYRLALPPLEEQVAIARYLDAETSKFDTLTAEAQRAIDLLQERRTALISAAITGQIDVRHLIEREAA